MSNEFRLLCDYMRYIANTMNYTSWSDEMVGQEFREKIENAKQEFLKQNVDFTKLSDEEYKMLGFQDWDEETKNLIPLWLFRLLPDETPLRSFCGSKELKKDADDDVRFGCTAYVLDF